MLVCVEDMEEDVVSLKEVGVREKRVGRVNGVKQVKISIIFCPPRVSVMRVLCALVVLVSVATGKN